jgi:heptosyltransferase-2
MGDAVLCTPALRAIRQHFKSCQITFFAKPVVRQALSPGSFNDEWLEQQSNNPFAIAGMLKRHKFTYAILFKNSFASALATFLAKIPSRIGYAREGRGFLLTEKLYPPKLPTGKFKPAPMVDYYLKLASALGAKTDDKTLQLSIDSRHEQELYGKLPEIGRPNALLIVIVPGGAFGPSKCWPSINFARTADWLITNYDATVIVSVASDPLEHEIAKQICDASNHTLINLAERALSLGQLKALFSNADLVISNDTGPRHIATAFGRKVISLFGPNDPAWTETGYVNEIQLIGDVPCAPCGKPRCKMSEHLCMQAITVEMVCNAAERLLKSTQERPASETRQRFAEISKSFFIDRDYETAFSESGLTSIEAVFSFDAGRNLTKNNLGPYRSRLQFEINSPLLSSSTTLFLKRYDRPPILTQLRNWFSSRRRQSWAFRDCNSADRLSAADISTPKTISYGEQWGIFFEKRSFIITEKIPNAESLERKLPNCFSSPPTPENLKLRRDFITQLAAFVKKFHSTNYRHRDLYFSHIFYSDSSRFWLIDLARAFKPILLTNRFTIKDIAQAYYSAPAKYFSNTDRMRFYLAYTGRGKLNRKDKVFIHKVINKARRMARHDIKHGRSVPFES